MKTDFLVVGSGIAGLTFALKASRLGKVTLATKRNSFDSNTADAQGGIAIPAGKSDEKKHIDDTLNAGRGICNKAAVELIVARAHERVQELSNWGVKFERDGADFKRTLEAGHSAARIIYNADATGRAIEHKLVMLAKECPDIRIMEDSILIDLVSAAGGKCLGATFLRENSFIETISAKFTILATGGLGQLYEKTTNPAVATGDGFAAAARAGATLENMEFVQFHPTKLDVPTSHPFLMSEVLRGEGGKLVNDKGEQFMQRYAKEGELAPRDVVARAIYLESLSGKVFLDIRHKKKDFLLGRFPTIYTKCLGFDIDLSEDLVPVTAAAHYICGGVKADLRGRTSVQNLYAIGEVACTGVHGANRLASNSLLEGLVFAHEAFSDVAGRLGKVEADLLPEALLSIREKSDAIPERAQLRRLMWEKVGLVRRKEGMQEAASELAQIRSRHAPVYKKGVNFELIEFRNMVETSGLIASAALRRKKSLGCHFVV